MGSYTKSGKKGKHSIRHEAIILRPREETVRVVGVSPQELFKKSLRTLGHLLSPGSCSSAHHYNCIMRIEVSAKNHCMLLANFLNAVLELTHQHHTIFCNMYIEEFTETKLVAQLYGTWFKDYEKDIKSIINHKCTVETKEDSSLHGLIVFEKL